MQKGFKKGAITLPFSLWFRALEKIYQVWESDVSFALGRLTFENSQARQVRNIELKYSLSRSKEKEEAKELAKEQETERIKNKIFELEFKQDKQTTQIRELSK